MRTVRRPTTYHMMCDDMMESSFVKSEPDNNLKNTSKFVGANLFNWSPEKKPAGYIKNIIKSTKDFVPIKYKNPCPVDVGKSSVVSTSTVTTTEIQQTSTTTTQTITTIITTKITTTNV
ncbi:hypothetical protein HCN44_004790 [Aphidius gifuensis]|uniref:Uncharacterized protein n=1 Tax=Aphidius gifuensis TaxID=684658 RepID=A0A835CKN7_APHGI|nr:hypothetical protein HCN44_004790 [Aphidius gifuensis]